MDYRRLAEILKKILENTEQAKRNGNAAALFSGRAGLVLTSRDEGGRNARRITGLRFPSDVDPDMLVPGIGSGKSKSSAHPDSPLAPTGSSAIPWPRSPYRGRGWRRSPTYVETIAGEPSVRNVPSGRGAHRASVFFEDQTEQEPGGSSRPRIPRGLGEYGNMAYQAATTRDPALRRRILNRLGKSPITKGIGGGFVGTAAGNLVSGAMGGGVVGRGAGLATAIVAGGATGGAPGAAGAMAGTAISNIRQNPARLADPTGIMTALYRAGKALHGFAETTMEARRNLGQWDPGTALSFVRSDYQKRIMDIKYARATGPGLERSMEAVTKMRESLQPLRQLWGRAENVAIEAAAKLVAVAADRLVKQIEMWGDIVDRAMHPGETDFQRGIRRGLEDFARKAFDQAQRAKTPWAQFLNDFAGLDRPRKGSAPPNPPGGGGNQ